jgi:hypothetical protein
MDGGTKMKRFLIMTLAVLTFQCGTYHPIDPDPDTEVDAGADCFERACSNMEELGCNDVFPKDGCADMLRDTHKIAHLDPCCIAELTDCEIDACDDGL